MSTKHEHHVLPLKVYLAVAGALFFLTAVTVGVSYIDFNAITGISGLNLVIAMLVATIKGTLVALIFMHLWFDDKLYSLAFVVGLVILGIFISVTLLDVEKRRGSYDERLNQPIVEQVEYKKADEQHQQDH
ncbi:cytochrome C oxidase subunit IV family protein [bacterium]|nr:cytochrome C oxidase subunit IV family protein [bacterium]